MFAKTKVEFVSKRRWERQPPPAGPRAGEAAGPASVTITQQELADLLGVTRATANAALGDLQRRRLIERGYGTIRIPDRDALAAHAMR